MSIKRQAPTELNHENWDQEDPPDQQEMGQFKSASKDVLEKRVIRTAKRRTQTSDEPTKSVFSGFGGFNKSQPSSFDFLANLTNGNKGTNGSTSASNGESTTTSSLFSNKPAVSGGGIFGIPSSTPATTPFKSTPSAVSTNSPFGNTTTSPFGAASLSTSPFGATTKTTPSAIFNATKADSKETPFKMQSAASPDDDKNKTSIPTPSIFGNASISVNDSKPMFTSSSSTPSKIQPMTSSATVQTTFDTSPKLTTTTSEKKNEEKPNEKKLKYYSKLKGLNESVLDWITKHVAKTPLCILSPIFKDYEKYLKEITEEYEKDMKAESGKDKEPVKTENDTKVSFGVNNTASAFNTNTLNASVKQSIFGAQNNISVSPNNKPSFSFGIKTSTTDNTSSSTTTTSTGFSFGVKSSTGNTTSSPFSLNTNTTTTQSSAPFSFGIDKPFSFSASNVQNNTEPAATEDGEDTPPKVEYTPLKEENSIYEKKCKVFIKNDNSFADKGVGTLYIKKIENSGKHQLLVRANNSLGTVLMNLVLAKAIPMQRMGKNNVMLVCIPTPEAKPPPTPMLIRVKTGEEADELLETLNQYKA